MLLPFFSSVSYCSSCTFFCLPHFSSSLFFLFLYVVSRFLLGFLFLLWRSNWYSFVTPHVLSLLASCTCSYFLLFLLFFFSFKSCRESSYTSFSPSTELIMYLVLALLFLLVIPLLHFIFCLLFISFFLSFLMLVIISLSLISLRLHLPVCCFSSRSKINNYCALVLAFVMR